MKPTFLRSIALMAMSVFGARVEVAKKEITRGSGSSVKYEQPAGTHHHRGLRARRGRHPRHLAPSRAWHVGRAKGAW